MRYGIGIVIAAGATAAASAGVSDMVTFGYTDLNGRYNADTGIFQASDSLMSAGDITRIGADYGTALFDDGFGNGSGQDGYFGIFVNDDGFGNLTGGGEFGFRDADGDTVSGVLINGEWKVRGSFITYDAEAVQVVFTDNGDQDGEFNGNVSGLFNMADLISDSWTGYVSLLFRSTTGFDDSFSDVSTQADGIILIPAPGTLALAGIGALACLRRRR